MKKLMLLLLFLLPGLSVKLMSQNNSNHPSISSVSVRYKAAPQGTVNSVLNIQAVPEATVSLVANSGATKIYFKIIDNTSNTVVYQVNYSLSSGTVTNGQGKKLFENSNGVLFISNGSPVTLKPYKFELYTENAQSVATPVFSVIQ